MGKYFCENLALKKEALKMAYICKLTKKVCPRVKYSVDGEASPDILFTLKGCALNKKEESVIEVKETKQEEIIEEKIIETVVAEESVVVETEEIKIEEPKVESKQATTPKQTNYNKKKKKNYNNQNKNQEQK